MIKQQTICLAVFSHVAVETPHQPLYQINSTTNYRCILGLMASRREQNTEREITHQHVPVSHSRLSGSSPARTVGHMLQPNPLPTTSTRSTPLQRQLAQTNTCAAAPGAGRGGSTWNLFIIHWSSGSVRIWLSPKYFHCLPPC